MVLIVFYRFLPVTVVRSPAIALKEPAGLRIYSAAFVRFFAGLLATR